MDERTVPVEKYGLTSFVGRDALRDSGRAAMAKFLGDAAIAHAQAHGYTVVGEPYVRFHDRRDDPFPIEGQDPDVLDVLTTLRVFRRT